MGSGDDNSVAGVLARLRANAISRNRNFELFQQPAARRAHRLHLLLQQLERELLACAERDTVQVRLDGYSQDDGPPRRVLEIVDDELRLRRQVYLSEEELDLLMKVPDIVRVLGETKPAGQDAPDPEG